MAWRPPTTWRREHGIRNVAVLEKGYLGGGSVGRNTTIVRSNYMLPGNTEFYEFSVKLWEQLAHELNYNVMFSQRGQIVLFHSPAARDAAARRANTMRMNGIDAEMLSRDQVRPRCRIWISPTAPASRFKAPSCRSAPAPRATMRSPGAMPAPPTAWASISSRTARSRGSCAKAAGSPASRPRAASSRPARWASRWPATPAA